MRSLAAIISCLLVSAVSSLDVNELNNEFAIHSVQQTDDRNILVSPLAVSRSLLLLLNSAKGRTEEEIRTVLGLKKEDDVTRLQQEEEQLIQRLMDRNGDDQELTLLVRLLVQKKGIQALKESFKRAVGEELKKALAEEVDFETDAKQVTKNVNDLLAKATRGRLTRFFRDDLDPKSSMVLLSASDWRGSARVNLSQSAERKEFANFISAELPFMKQMVPYLETSAQELRLQRSAELKSQLLEVPFERNFSLVIVQPTDEEALNWLNENLTSALLTSGLKELMKETPQRLKVNIPRLKVEFDLELKDFLEDFFDAKTLFNSSAEFGADGQRVTTSVHRAAFELKENSPPLVETPSGDVKEFSVEKPFLLVVRDNSLETIAMIGKVSHLVDEEALGLGLI